MSAADALKFSSFSDDEIAEIFEPLKAVRSMAVAVSGGPDSMALMLMLASWCARTGENAPQLHVLSVDHGLRRESADEIEFVARVCRQYDLPHKAFSWCGPKSKGNIPANSRNARYDLMCDWCAQHRVSHLLVAHTLDDQAETVLLRLARGSGVDGLSAMARSRAWNTTMIYRPLLGVERSRLLQLLDEAQCPYVSDPSNHDLKYDRVQIRQALEVLEPLGISSHGLAKTAGRLAQAREALDIVTEQAIAMSVVIHDAGYCILKPEKLEKFPYEIRRRLLASLLRAVAGRSYAPPHSSLDNLLSWVLAPNGPTRTLGDCLLMSRQGKIWVIREIGREALPEVLLYPGQSVLWDHRIKVALSACAENPMVVKALGVDTYAAIKATLEAKNRYPSALAAGLPSFWQDEELIAVPHLNFGGARFLCQIEAGFANSGQLTQAITG